MRYFFLLLWLIVFGQASGQRDANDSTLHFTTAAQSRAAIGDVYHYQFEAKDPAAKPLTFSVKDLPVWLQYHEADHSITGKSVKAGQYPVHILVSNEDTTVHQDFMLTVYDEETINILPLGNSITNGVSTYNSYRRDLWKMLHAAGYNFDLIGSWDSHHMGSAVPDPDFDLDHEGHSGWTYDNMFHPPDWDSARGNITMWLQSYRPDIVLLELGTNDVFQCRTVEEDIKDLTKLVDLLREKNPQVKIFLAQIPPLGPRWDTATYCGHYTLGTLLKKLNQQVAVFARTHTTQQSPLIIVDQFSGILPSKDQFDDIHPNASGEKIMAERWFRAIRKYLKKLKT